jgi:hypothetical protein
MMNVDKPRHDLMKSDPLPNIGFVVGGRPGHWRLLEWNGTKP